MLSDWGWDDRWARCAADLSPGGGRPARVVGQERDRCAIHTEEGPGQARLVSEAGIGGLPVVGDWILVEPGPMESDPWSITSVLPRRSSFSRGAAGSGAVEQVLAANVDVVWIVHGLDLAVNARSLERYLAVAWESGAVPEVILTKSDLVQDVEAATAEARAVAVGVRIWSVSSADAMSVALLRGSLHPGSTVALLGPSGAGKSTLVNVLGAEDRALTSPVREYDRKGRHTTTRRELYRIPGGALLLDTPGIRELRVWTLGDGLDQAFPEVFELAKRCRFRDCAHDTEPGCAVRAAETAGRIDPERLASFKKLQAEAVYQMRKADPLAQRAALSDHKSALKTMKYHHKLRRPE